MPARQVILFYSFLFVFFSLFPVFFFRELVEPTVIPTKGVRLLQIPSLLTKTITRVAKVKRAMESARGTYVARRFRVSAQGGRGVPWPFTWHCMSVEVVDSQIDMRTMARAIECMYVLKCVDHAAGCKGHAPPPPSPPKKRERKRELGKSRLLPAQSSVCKGREMRGRGTRVHTARQVHAYTP